jgi:hypothetical protein
MQTLNTQYALKKIILITQLNQYFKNDTLFVF